MFVSLWIGLAVAGDDSSSAEHDDNDYGDTKRAHSGGATGGGAVFTSHGGPLSAVKPPVPLVSTSSASSSSAAAASASLSAATGSGSSLSGVGASGSSATAAGAAGGDIQATNVNIHIASSGPEASNKATQTSIASNQPLISKAAIQNQAVDGHQFVSGHQFLGANGPHAYSANGHHISATTGHQAHAANGHQASYSQHSGVGLGLQPIKNQPGANSHASLRTHKLSSSAPAVSVSPSSYNNPASVSFNPQASLGLSVRGHSSHASYNKQVPLGHHGSSSGRVSTIHNQPGYVNQRAHVSHSQPGYANSGAHASSGQSASSVQSHFSATRSRSHSSVHRQDPHSSFSRQGHLSNGHGYSQDQGHGFVNLASTSSKLGNPVHASHNRGRPAHYGHPGSVAFNQHGARRFNKHASASYHQQAPVAQSHEATFFRGAKAPVSYSQGSFNRRAPVVTQTHASQTHSGYSSHESSNRGSNPAGFIAHGKWYAH